MRFNASDNMDTGGGNFLNEPGTYHFVVLSADDCPTVNGKVIDGVQVKLVAMEGTTRDAKGQFTERDKQVSLTFWHPKLTDKNEGEFSRKKLTRLFVATGLMSPQQLGRDVDIDLNKMAGRQVIATVERDEQNDKYLRLHFAEIYHIDDPAAPKCPRCEKTLALIPAALRCDAKIFPGKSSPPPQKPKTGPDTSVDLSDL